MSKLHQKANVRSYLPLQDFLENMTMAFVLILIAVTHQSERIPLGERLEKSQGKFLAVVFNKPIPLVDCSALKQLTSILFSKFRPSDPVIPKLLKKLFARPETCHPDIVS